VLTDSFTAGACIDLLEIFHIVGRQHISCLYSGSDKCNRHVPRVTGVHPARGPTKSGHTSTDT